MINYHSFCVRTKHKVLSLKIRQSLRYRLGLYCLVLMGFLSLPTAHAEATPSNAQAYLTKYLTYLFWVQHLPDTPKPEFIEFIEPTTPLTQKLREKWLYLLAERQNWTQFQSYYRPTDNLGLRCYAQLAGYRLQSKPEAISEAMTLWLLPETQSSAACQHVMTTLMHEHAFSTLQMEQKVAAVLAQNQASSAYTLLLKMGQQYQPTAQALNQIKQNPRQIAALHPGPLAGALYLYGLNLMLTRSLDMAITYWQHPLRAHLLNPEQNQQFLAHLALYKIMRNQKDAEKWLQKVQPAYYDQTLRDWAIRHALLQKNWQKIIQLTAEADTTDNNPFQTYWRARALAKLKQSSEARRLYQNLASKRHYYGFLASIALQQPFHFESEPSTQDLSVLAPYKTVTDQIADYYQHHQTYLAAHTLNEFSLELSKPEKSALVYWVATYLHWPGKAIYLSTTDEVLNNQLTLRFPLNYQTHIQKLSRQYQISPALIYATIRQESTFLEDIKSSAGAYGLMQILPRTAKTVAKQAKIPFSNANELYHPEKNLQIGVAYLSALNRQFKAHPILTMAAYNAGPKQVRHWVNTHSPKEMDIWIETLPWQETRNYLKNVIAFYAVYQYRVQQAPNISPFLQKI